MLNIILLKKIDSAQKNSCEELDLSNQDIVKLPPDIWNLNKLKKLDISTNYRMESLPPEIGRLEKLEVLNINSNRLKRLPFEIGKLTNLQVLHIKSNALSQIPSEIGMLKNLTHLFMGYNRLNRLPLEIGNLQKLEVLNMCKNGVKFLHPQICNLINLRELILYGNWELSALPDGIDRLKKLELLDLREINIEFTKMWNNLDKKTKIDIYPAGSEKFNQYLHEISILGTFDKYVSKKYVVKKISARCLDVCSAVDGKKINSFEILPLKYYISRLFPDHADPAVPCRRAIFSNICAIPAPMEKTEPILR